MISDLNAELVAEVQRRSIDQCLELALELASAVDGVGDHTLTRAQRIQQFMARAASGSLDIMKDLRPDLYRQAVKQYLDDIKASPLVGQPEVP